jgi:pimeloyl-ACP methyl ester carboxylesterase
MILDTFNRLVRRRLVSQGARAVTRVIDGRRLHFYELDGRGDAPPAVLVHGLGGSANGFFSILEPLRASHRRLYVPDLPGHGFTPLEAGESPLGLQEHFDVLQRFLDEVVREPPVVIGNSMGGALVLETAVRRPETRGVGLLSPAGAPLGVEGLHALRNTFSLQNRHDGARMLGQMLHRAPPGSWLLGSAFRENFDTAVVRHVVAAANAEESLSPAALGRLTMPITLVWGASEKILPLRGLDFFRAHLPAHARIEVFERCGHVPMIEQPGRTVKVLQELARAATGEVRLAASA